MVMASIDISQAYFHFSVKEEHKKFLRFRWGMLCWSTRLCQTDFLPVHIFSLELLKV